MKKMRVLGAVMAVALACSGPALAQDTLIWFNTAEQIHPDGNGNVPHDPSASPTSLVGAMVQLILAGGGVADAPAYLGGPPFENTTGVTGDDSLLAFGYFGLTFTADGFFSQDNTFANLGITQASLLYVRVYSDPSSDGGGDLPTPQQYTDLDLLALYPAAGVMLGTFYFDGPVQLANEEDLTGGFFGYTIPTVGQGGWTFLPAAVIPEPGALVLAGLGGLVALVLRRRK